MSRRTEGRYGSDRSARMPSNGLAKPLKTKNVAVTRAAVPDPLEPGARILVAANCFVDVLEIERSHHRISEAAYNVGRELQAVFEAATTVGGGGQWRESDRVDPVLAKEIAIHRNIEAARRVDTEMMRLVREVGEIGAQFLREILTGITFAQYAARVGSTERRDVALVAGRFRTMLEDIVQCRQARGRVSHRPRDKFDEVASELKARYDDPSETNPTDRTPPGR